MNIDPITPDDQMVHSVETRDLSPGLGYFCVWKGDSSGMLHKLEFQDFLGI